MGFSTIQLHHCTTERNFVILLTFQPLPIELGYQHYQDMLSLIEIYAEGQNFFLRLVDNTLESRKKTRRSRLKPALPANLAQNFFRKLPARPFKQQFFNLLVLEKQAYVNW